MIRQGEVYTYGRGRIVVLSNEEVNETYPIAAPLGRGTQDLPPFMVALADQDPIAGTVHVGRLAFCDPTLLEKPAGLLTGATMSRILESVHTLFESLDV